MLASTLIMCSEQEGIGEEMIVACFKLLSLNSNGKLEEPQSMKSR